MTEPAVVPPNGAPKKATWRPWFARRKSGRDEHEGFVTWRGLLAMFGASVVVLLSMAAAFGLWVYGVSDARAQAAEATAAGAVREAGELGVRIEKRFERLDDRLDRFDRKLDRYFGPMSPTPAVREPGP